MNVPLLESVPPLLPVDFFRLSLGVPYVKREPFKGALLPDTSALLNEEPFAQVFLGWSEEGVSLLVKVNQPFQESFYPDYAKGDSMEFFFDTRDVKSAGYATGFCHHFILLPQPAYGIRVQEVTHFRSEESHPLCDPDLIEVESDMGRKHYEMKIFFPSAALHGFDPVQCPRLGFTYKLNRYQGAPQHFTLSSVLYNIGQQSSLWASLHFLP
ncbi:MAG: hypothetical protein A2Y28_02675 [Chlamydiae bacterium GWC2_50_10]|nr:MAG: hypothetical protein A2Z85_03610 [Chlamydiae bacterium GWA2_50_15]OGN53881.1 MAG: hypothetical protein A2Y28_02675 [Chlamydiae bacterium GWC2_50_10]OGN63166.1 MAG: hypothetical protein A3E26_06265 [Chlamydiae bacterium RIFCSPHIGHO2_12_FULL_49_32]OGN67639.1 MAG: hypothetical protein A3I15_02960 [Chlamydiae bacterium RIFCSPLOWO2_02_FULL_49_12]OGN70908.1 MAG: hypothetical protein A3G30_06140 [Chlamydiae bacterium RIFCSPLOWO2_12_FULL_49_12]